MSISTPHDVTAGYPKPSYAIYVLGVLMLAAIVSLIDRQILTLLVGSVRHDLHITDTQVSLLQGFAFASFYAIMGLPLGLLVDRVHRRNLIIVGVALWSIMTFMCGLSHSFWQLFFARMGVGVGEALLHPAAYSLLADYFPLKNRARVYSAFSAGGTIGISMSWLFGGAVLAMLHGAEVVDVPFLGALAAWKVVFLIAGSPGVLLIALLFTLKEPQRRERALVGAGAASASLSRFLRANWRVVGLLMTVNALMALAGYGVLAWMAMGFVRTYHIKLQTSGLICGLIVFASALIGAGLAGPIADRWTMRGVMGGKLRVPAIAGLIGAACFAAWWLVDDLRLAIVFAVCAYSANVAISSVMPTALNELVPNELRGRMSAIYLLVAGVCGIGLGPTAIALCTDYVFKSDMALRYSIIVVAVPVLLACSALSWAGLKLYSRSLLARRAEMADA